MAGREERKVRHKLFIPGPCEVDEEVLAARRRHEGARCARMRVMDVTESVWKSVERAAGS
jgi:aspartate aminotransferase-like enzyme